VALRRGGIKAGDDFPRLAENACYSAGKEGIGNMILTMAMAAALAAQAAPANQAKPPRRARANLSQYFSADDYPPSALARSATGTVGFRLDIDAEGLVTRCTITRSSSDPALDSATCAILLGRATYEPARDAAGRAVPGKDEGRVTWRLPPPAPWIPFARVRTVSRLSADGAGGLSCTFTSNGVAQPDAAPSRCGMLAGAGADHVLRQVPAPSELIMVTVSGPADSGMEPAGEDEAGFGLLRYDMVSDYVIGQDGRVARCSIVRRTVAPNAPPAEIPEMCAPLPPGAPPMFEPSTDPAPRRARHRFALYAKGWIADQLAAPAPAPPRP
jgi:TonB family protein